ncbi:hypothetical protein GCM10009754_28570 [Amycolatopsis minnesotensis]|uniref:Uncharacterized protein n=1 Tax=Amycolatopsis minnesotensis TaxID=337894 RepID=A0ABP5C2P5_9PSEU
MAAARIEEQYAEPLLRFRRQELARTGAIGAQTVYSGLRGRVPDGHSAERLDPGRGGRVSVRATKRRSSGNRLVGKESFGQVR